MVVATPPRAVSPISATHSGSYIPAVQAASQPATGSTAQPSKAVPSQRCRGSTESRKSVASHSRPATGTNPRRSREVSQSFLCRGSGSGGGGGGSTRSFPSSGRRNRVGRDVQTVRQTAGSDSCIAQRVDDELDPPLAEVDCIRNLANASVIGAAARADSHPLGGEELELEKVRELHEMKQKVQLLTVGLKLLQRHLEDQEQDASVAPLRGDDQQTSLSPLCSPPVRSRTSPSADARSPPGTPHVAPVTVSVFPPRLYAVVPEKASLAASSGAGSLSPASRGYDSPGRSPPEPCSYYQSHIAIPRSEDAEFAVMVEARPGTNEEAGCVQGNDGSLECFAALTDARRCRDRVPPSPAPSTSAESRSPMASALVKPASVGSAAVLTTNTSFPSSPFATASPRLASPRQSLAPSAKRSTVSLPSDTSPFLFHRGGAMQTGAHAVSSPPLRQRTGSPARSLGLLGYCHQMGSISAPTAGQTPVRSRAAESIGSPPLPYQARRGVGLDAWLQLPSSSTAIPSPPSPRHPVSMPVTPRGETWRRPCQHSPPFVTSPLPLGTSAGSSRRATLPPTRSSNGSSSPGVTRRATLPSSLGTGIAREAWMMSRAPAHCGTAAPSSPPLLQATSIRTKAHSSMIDPLLGPPGFLLECWASLLCSAYCERRAEEGLSLLSVKARGIKVLEWSEEERVIVQAGMSWTGLGNCGMEAGEDLAQFVLQLSSAPTSRTGDHAWRVASLTSFGEAAANELRHLAAETGRLIIAEALSGMLWKRLRPTDDE